MRLLFRRCCLHSQFFCSGFAGHEPSPRLMSHRQLLMKHRQLLMTIASG